MRDFHFSLHIVIFFFILLFRKKWQEELGSKSPLKANNKENRKGKFRIEEKQSYLNNSGTKFNIDIHSKDSHECRIPQSDICLLWELHKYICLLLKVKFSSIKNHASSKANKFGGLTQPHSAFPIKTMRTLLVCLLISSKCILLVRWPSLILLIAIQPAILPPAHVMHLKSVIHIRHHQLTRQACHNYMLQNFPLFQWNTVPVEIMCMEMDLYILVAMILLILWKFE